MVGFGVIFYFLLGSHLDCLNSLHWTHATFRKNMKVIVLKEILKSPVVEINRKKGGKKKKIMKRREGKKIKEIKEK